MHGSTAPTLRDLARSALLDQIERTPEPTQIVTRSQCLERALERAGRESYADLRAFRTMLREEFAACTYAAEIWSVLREHDVQLELVDTAGWKGRAAWRVALELVHDESIVYGVIEPGVDLEDDLRLIRRRCRSLARVPA